MKSKIEALILEAIGEDMQPPYKEEDFEKQESNTVNEVGLRNVVKHLQNNIDWEKRYGYNKALSDLRLKVPELAEKIEEMLYQ